MLLNNGAAKKEPLRRDRLENVAGYTVLAVFVGLVAAEIHAAAVSHKPMESRFVDILFGFVSSEIRQMTIGRGSGNGGGK